jgi:hypothetical protein
VKDHGRLPGGVAEAGADVLQQLVAADEGKVAARGNVAAKALRAGRRAGRGSGPLRGRRGCGRGKARDRE